MKFAESLKPLKNKYRCLTSLMLTVSIIFGANRYEIT